MHEYFDEDGVQWQRVFLPTLAAVDTKFDPFSSKDFVNKTSRRKGTLGELMEKSAELSEKREKLVGKDQVKEKYYENYAAKRKNKPHPDLKKKQAIQTLNNKGVTIDYD